MDKKLKFTDAEKANFDAIISEINGFMQYHKQQETPPSISELDQFHKRVGSIIIGWCVFVN